MRKAGFIITGYFILSLSRLAAQCPSGLAGTYTIGPAGNFTSITSAVTALQANGLANHVILELQSGYSGVVETYPLSFPSIPCQHLFSITLRPATGTSGFNISTGASSATLVLDSIQNLVIDGRPGGTGTAKELTIQNTAVNGSAVNLNNDASSNTLQYLFVKSTPTAVTNGIIIFNATTDSTGNDNNKISFCEIGNPVAFSSNLVYATGTPGKENNNNEISNNNFFNFFSNSVNSSGINIEERNRDYIISNNSFYQTAGATNFGAAALSNTAIRINTPFGNSFTINGNAIGGTAPNCGGTPLLCSGAGSFTGIYFNTDTSGTSAINNNTIANLSLSLTANTCFPAGIFVAGGKVDIGTVSGNTIGSQLVTNNISINSTATGTNPVARFAGVYVSSQDTVSISNNLIGGIAGSGTGRLVTYGIQLTGTLACYNVTGNTIGNPSLANSVTNNVTTFAHIYGINSGTLSVTRTQTINGNIIANLTSTTTNGGGQVAGIFTSGGKHFILNNTVRNISGSSLAGGAISNSSVIGISCISGTGIQAISGNTIYAISNNHPFGSMGLIGLNVCNGSVSSPMIVSNNFIHSLSATTSGNALLTGIYSGCGNTSFYNNMVRLGIDANGTSIIGDYEIRGIFQGTASAHHKYSFNSVYLGGSSTGGFYTYAFFNSDSLRPTTITNNIFVNARSNSNPVGGKNYATVVGSSRKKPQELTMNGNLYYAPGTAGYFGTINGTDYTSISAWRDATGLDSLSGVGNPNFINPTGNASSVNLHLTGTTPAEGAGIADTLVQDYDNQTRSGLTPVDIGADAANLTPSDIFTPSISFTALNNTTSLLNRTIQARITDGASGVHTSGSLQPRIWFRRSAPAASAWVSVQGSLISGNGNDGLWNFIIDYSLTGGAVSPQDIYQYYFIAQDIAGNIEIIPALGASHTNVNTQITAPSNSLSYTILDIVPAVINVGAGEPFTTLTGNGGLFQFVNRSVMTGNVVANITSDLSEPGTYSLNADSTYGYQLLIQPSAASLRTISNSANLTKAMIRVIDIKNVVFDGRSNGSGRFLRFINTHTTPASCTPVFLLDSSSNNIIIRNSVIECNNDQLTGNNGNIVFGINGVNKNNEVRNNQIRDAAGLPGTTGLVGQCINSRSITNKQLIIVGNEIFNFTRYGVNFQYVGDSCLVDSNHFFFNSLLPTTAVPAVIRFESGKAHTISNNFIGGSTTGCGGAPWTVPIPYGVSFTGIFLLRFEGGLPNYITGNTIQNIHMTNTTDASIIGIGASGNMIVTNNLIGHPSVPNSIMNAGTGNSATTVGIQAAPTDSVVVLNNTVTNLTATGTSGTVNVIGLYISDNGQQTGKRIINGNHVYNLTSSSSSSNLSYIPAVTGIFMSQGKEYHLENNLVHDLKATNTTPNVKIVGIRISSLGGNPVINRIKRNRIYNLESLSDSCWIFGIDIEGLPLQLENNQIAVTNGSNTNRATIAGIYDLSDSSYHYYNTVYIGGNANSGNLNSYAYKLNDGRLKRFQNNILYNERTGGGGAHYAMGAAFNPNPDPKWTSTSSNFNFFAARDSAKINAWSFSNTPQSIISWRTVSQGDTNSFAALTTNVPAASFFQSVATGNLNINNNNPLCWYVNGKGLPVATISGDYDSAANIRSTTIAGGATDIGSDEFNTTTLPPPLIILGRHLPGFTDSLMMNGRLIATITWGNTGTLPAFGNARYFSGTWPNDTTNGLSVSNARTMNAWLDMPVTGGSGYSYTLTLYYDSSMLGKIQNASQIVLHKKNSGEAGSWQMLFPTQINIAAKTATASGLTGFSEFTGAEYTAPLAPPGSGICASGTTNYKTNITGAGYTYQWQVNTGSGFVNITDNTVYSGTTDSILTISSPSSGSNGYLYRCVTNTGTGTVNSPEFKLKITSTWMGTSNTDWSNPVNWSCGQVPDANTDVIIKSGLTNYPVINTAIVCRSIIASPGSVIQVNAGGAVQLTGNQ